MAEVITKFKLETTQFDSKLRDSAKSLADLTGKLMIAGKDFDRFASKNVEAAKALGNIAPSANNAKDKVKELVTAYNDVSKAYNKLTVEQKNTDYGKALAGSLVQLKGKVTDAKQELYGLGDAMEKGKSAGVDFNSVLASLGQRFGINSELMGVLTSSTFATTAAITAGAAAVAAATKMWADYNNELSKQSQVTTVTTGLKGDDAENLTIGVRALVKTYGVDFREAINAANTLIQQFGVSGEKALSLLQDGMQGMIEGDGGKLLSMIQQYAPAFQSAGVSASQLVAVIQNSEGGIFTDQNMQAIIMALPKIKMMSENTAKALAGIGIDGKKMAADVESGSMTVFEALQQISKAIEDNKDKTRETGIVMQEMFGRQARTAGDNLGKAIAQLNTNLEETKKQTGSVGESLAELNKAQEEFERTASELFGMNGWQEMANVIKTEVIVGLTGMTDNLQNFKDLLVGASSWFDSIRAGLDTLNNPIGTILFNLREAKSLLDGLRGAKDGVSGSGGQIGGGVGGLIPAPKPKPQHTYTETVDESGRLVKATRDGNDVTEEVKKIKNPSPSNTTIQPTNTTPKVGGSKKETWAPIEMQALGGLSFGRSIKDVQADLSRAQGAYNIAEDESSRAAAKKMVEAYQQELETMKNEGDVTKGLMKDAYTHDFGKDMDTLSKELKNEQKTTQLSETEQVKQMGAMVGGIQQMVGGIAQLGIEIPEGFQSMLGGLQGIMTILQAIQTIQTVGSVLGLFHNGGIVPHAATGLMVPGNDFSDSTPVMVSSGELILNKAQQNAVAQGLQEERGRGGYSSTPYVDGEKIFLGMNNFLRRSGRGEIVTSRR